MSYRLLLLAHLLGVIVWVGGMFFAHMALRPAVAETLQPPERMRLMAAVLGRFFTWVEWSIVLILGSGIVMMGILGGARGMFAVPAYIHAMFGIGIVMMALFGHIRFAAYRRFSKAVAAADWPAAAPALGQIRLLVAINLGLGLLVVVIAAAEPGIASLV
ncbi:MAG: integral rane protein [Betaproteobacteria bacterium]|nr:integral rane protein [Betaproteobacteria bacterium]